MSQPNILWICTDQQRYDTLNCYGNPFVHTPHLDGLAERGALFAHAFSQSPVRTERFKLTVDHPASDGELYDLGRDPMEMHNLWNDAGYAKVKTAMLIRLCNRMAWTVDPLPPRRAAW